jgi:hypothetical protein
MNHIKHILFDYDLREFNSIQKFTYNSDIINVENTGLIFGNRNLLRTEERNHLYMF